MNTYTYERTHAPRLGRKGEDAQVIRQAGQLITCSMKFQSTSLWSMY